MTKWKRALGLFVALVSGANISSALAQQLDSQQLEVIRKTAASICDTIKEAKGQKGDTQIEGEVKAQLGGLVGKLADLGITGKGSMIREEFEGLSRDATAAALEGDRNCRERLFKEMFNKLTTPPSEQKSGMSKAEKLIAIVDLGYTISDRFAGLEGVTCVPGDRFLDPCSHCTLELAEVNSAAARLGIPPYDESHFAKFERSSGRSVVYGSSVLRHVYDHFKYHLNSDPDDLAAYWAGADIGRLAHGGSVSYFEVTADSLRHQLTSLNLGDVMNQIPNSVDGVEYPWANNFIASLRGLIHKNYPAMSLSQ